MLFLYPPNENRKATTYSIAAHTLYEEDHPTLQFYPEGILSFRKTDYFSVGERSAGIRNSIFINRPLSIKIEGSRKIGERYVSLLFCKDLKKIPNQYPVYGRNGVESEPVNENESEIGLLIKVTSNSEEVAEGLLTLWKGLFLHSGYPGRRTTAGNLGFPSSPADTTYKDKNGKYVSLVIAGTRDPFFQANFERIKEEAQRHVDLEYSILGGEGHTEIVVATKAVPIMYLETVEATKEEAFKKHQQGLKTVERFIDTGRPSLQAIYTGEVFKWGIYHVFTNTGVIRERMFPVSIYSCDGKNWKFLREVRPAYKSIGIDNVEDEIDPEKLNAVNPAEHTTGPRSIKPLVDIARIIRSKNAGINKITYDVFFNTKDDYFTALNSNLFLKNKIAEVLGIPIEQVIGTYRADECYAIKISVHRSLLSGSLGDRDVFGAQQHMKLLQLKVPLF